MDDKQWQWEFLDDGTHADKTKDDGIYTLQLDKSLEQGEYEFVVNLDGTTFKRNKRQLITVHKYPVSAQIIPIDAQSFALSIIPYDNLINVESMKLSVYHKAPRQKSERVDIPRISPAEWRLEFKDQKHIGKHQIKVRLTANDKNNHEIKIRLPNLHYETSALAAGTEPAAEAPVVEAEQPPVESGGEAEGKPVSWVMVSLRVMIFNVLLIILALGGYFLWPHLNKKLFPMPSEV